MEQLALTGNETPEAAAAMSLHYEIVAAAQVAANGLLDLGRKLKRMRDTAGYKQIGFESFADYTERAVGIRQRQAYTYIGVVEKLPAQLIEENAAAGVTKLALLAKLGPADQVEVAGDLANITVAELQKLIDEKNGLCEQLSLLNQAPDVEASAVEVDVEAQITAAAEQARAEAEAATARLWEKKLEAIEAKAGGAMNALDQLRAEQEKKVAEAVKKTKKQMEDQAKREKAAAEAKAKKEIELATQAAAKKAKADAEEAVAKARREAEAAQAAKDAEALEQAKREAAAQKAKAEDAAKRLRLQANANGTKFALLFEDVQKKTQAILDLADKLEAEGEGEEASRYRAAIAAALRALADMAKPEEQDEKEETDAGESGL